MIPRLIGHIIIGWLVISQVIFFLWSLRPKYLFDIFDWSQWPNWKRPFAFFIGISALFGFSYILSEGFKSLLLIIPEYWGYIDEDGDWFLIKDSVAYLISALALVASINAIWNYNKRRREEYSKEDENTARANE